MFRSKCCHGLFFTCRAIQILIRSTNPIIQYESTWVYDMVGEDFLENESE